MNMNMLLTCHTSPSRLANRWYSLDDIIVCLPIAYSVAALGCLFRGGNFLSVGRQASFVVEIRSYLKLYVTSAQ